MPISEFMELAPQLSDALRLAHFNDVCHRDIKPANILLDSIDGPKLSDFGIARRITESSGAATMCCSPVYAAPEVLRGEVYGKEVDIYSAGTVFFEMLSGHLPFTAKTWIGLATEKSAGQHSSLSDIDHFIPPWLSDIVDRMLSSDPGLRPSAEQVHTELMARGRQRANPDGLIDDFQQAVAFVYGNQNQKRGPLLVAAHIVTSMEGLVGGLRSPDQGYGERRALEYFPKVFAWISGLLTLLNATVSQLIAVKFEGCCPYCDSAPCNCFSLPPRPRDELNRDLLQKLRTDGRFSAIGENRSLNDYALMFASIYGSANSRKGLDGVCSEAQASVSQVLDALLRLKTLVAFKEGDILQLELADLAAWFFALLNVFCVGHDYDVGAAITEMYGSGCPVCELRICQCLSVDNEIRLVNWRSFS